MSSAWQALRCPETPGVAIFFEESGGAKQARLLRFDTLEKRLSEVLRLVPPASGTGRRITPISN